MFARLFSLLIVAGVLLPQAGHAQPLQTSAAQAILVDFDTGTVLFEKAADELIVPASMVKVMTAAVIYEELAKGRLKRDDEMAVSENAWRKGGAPSGGSTMFAAINSRIKVSDLLQGLIVHSGNDAAMVLAEGLAGTEASFARLMTDRAREIGMPKSVFRNASGLADPQQRSTARELAKLAAHVIETYPEEYKVFAQREFTWNRIRQQNRNPLLAMEIGADGLKTGNIDDSGFGLIGSAVQDGQRLILVVHGLKTARERAAEARRLLDWGFRSFESRMLFPAGETVGWAQVFGGDRGSVELVAKRPIRLLVPRGTNERVSARIVYTGPIRAPIAAGQPIGRLQVTRGEIRALDLPLMAREDVPTGSMTRRAWDALWELTVQWGRKAVSKALEQGS